MKITHSIALSVGKSEREEFAKIGIDLREGFQNFQIDENDSKWPAVSEVARLFKAVDTIATKFSAQEVSAASHLGLAPAWHHGYPEPADDFQYLNSTYDISCYCKTCGAGLVQTQPFRVKKEPSWGTKSVVQLNWVFDEYFVLPAVWEDLFKPRGIECRPVLIHETGLNATTIVQLDIKSIADLNIEAQTKELCSTCGRQKFAPVARGYYPSPIHQVGSHIFKSSQYFGTGHRAFRLTIVSADLHKAMMDAQIKGVNFKPCS